jgi:RNA-directed DNA polymerase
MDKKILREFLTAGYITGPLPSYIHDTDIGTPQGGPISPTLANMTLDGLDHYAGDQFTVVRYADDFIVIGS